MKRVTLGRDCGNSPRKLFLQEFYMAIYEGDQTFIANHLHHNIQWEFPGITLEDRESCLKYIEKYRFLKIAELSLIKIITHGAEAAVIGSIATETGMDYQFCDIFTFISPGKSAIKSIISFQKSPEKHEPVNLKLIQ